MGGAAMTVITSGLAVARLERVQEYQLGLYAPLVDCSELPPEHPCDGGRACALNLVLAGDDRAARAARIGATLAFYVKCEPLGVEHFFDAAGTYLGPADNGLGIVIWVWNPMPWDKRWLQVFPRPGDVLPCMAAARRGR